MGGSGQAAGVGVPGSANETSISMVIPSIGGNTDCQLLVWGIPKDQHLCREFGV